MSEHLRVTEILYPFSGLKHVDPTILENAAVRGTKVHSICEGIMQGIEWDVPEEYKGYVDSFMDWYVERPKVISQEQRFFCDDLMITGQVDVITETKDGCVIVDLKTSQRESRSWLLQGSAYSYLAKKAGYKIVDILFLKLERDGKAARRFYYDENFTLFRETLNVYRYFWGKKEKHG